MGSQKRDKQDKLLSENSPEMASRAVTRRRVVAGAPVDGGAWRRVEAPFAAKLLPVARLFAPINAQ